MFVRHVTDASAVLVLNMNTRVSSSCPLSVCTGVFNTYKSWEIWIWEKTCVFPSTLYIINIYHTWELRVVINTGHFIFAQVSDPNRTSAFPTYSKCCDAGEKGTLPVNCAALVVDPSSSWYVASNQSFCCCCLVSGRLKQFSCIPNVSE